MSEGLFFYDTHSQYLPSSIIENIDAIVRVYPSRLLHFSYSEKESSQWRFEHDETGHENIYIPVDESWLIDKNDPDVELAIFKYEAISHYRRGGAFPATLNISGSATGFITTDGYLVSSYHILSGYVKAAESLRLISGENYFRCQNLTVTSQTGEDLGEFSLSFWPDEKNRQEGMDLVILTPNSNLNINGLKVSNSLPRFWDKSYMLGYPMRTGREEDSLQILNYKNADGTLRISCGLVLESDEENLLTDCDGGPGNSGSPLFNEEGEVIGIYQGSLGSGLRKYDGVLRNYVPSSNYYELLKKK